MTEKAELFKVFLTKEYFEKYACILDKEIFPDILQELFDSLVEAHKQTTKDISCRDVWYVHTTRFPTLTEANKNILKDVLAKIHDAESLNPDVVEHVITSALKELKATRIAQAALAIAQGKAEDFSEIQSLLEDKSHKIDVDFVTTDVEELLNTLNKTYIWQFNLPELNEKIGKIGPEVFCILAGPVNSGKSLMGISFVFGPGGFAEQGAKCLYIGNEESLKRTMLRGISCYTGMPREELTENPKKAQELYNKIRKNIFLLDDVTMTFGRLESVIKNIRPDIVVIDMLDKVKIGGQYARGDERLSKVYEMAREIAKKYQCVVFGLSQTNGDTFGQLNIDQNQLANSRVDKTANADLTLTLGQLPSTEENKNFRCINIAKSKLEGNGQKVNCMIQPRLSRLVP